LASHGAGTEADASLLANCVKKGQAFVFSEYFTCRIDEVAG
jgi:hypothetical protein